MTSSLVKGLMPLRALVAGLRTVLTLSRPGRTNSPTAFFLTCPSMTSVRQQRTRRRNLLALGINPERVHLATRSRKGYWRMSQNELVRVALNNHWLEEQGVPDMNAPAAVAARKNREA